MMWNIIVTVAMWTFFECAISLFWSVVQFIRMKMKRQNKCENVRSFTRFDYKSPPNGVEYFYRHFWYLYDVSKWLTVGQSTTRLSVRLSRLAKWKLSLTRCHFSVCIFRLQSTELDSLAFDFSLLVGVESVLCWCCVDWRINLNQWPIKSTNDAVHFSNFVFN